MRCSVLLTRCLLPCCLLVASAADSQQNAPPLYQIEIVVFEHIGGNRAEEDFFHDSASPWQEPPPRRLSLPDLELETLAGFIPRSERPVVAAEPEIVPAPDPETPAPDSLPVEVPADALRLFDPAPAGRTPAGFGSGMPASFRVLGPDELELGDVRSDIYRRREYRVLGHGGWVQPGVDENEALAVDLRLLGITNPAGTIKVYLRRFLHAQIDLTFTDGRNTYWTWFPGTSLELLQRAQSYHHDVEHNAIRSGQLVYIDHPLFGIFLRITPAPERPEPGTAADGPAA